MYKAIYLGANIPPIIKEEIDNDIIEQFRVHEERIDQFVYYLNLYQTILTSANEYLQYQPDMNFYEMEFWKEIQLLQNYVNSVLCFKDFLWKYDATGSRKEDIGPVGCIEDEYYNKKGWIRFLYEYRNLINHASRFGKDYNPNNGDVYVDVDELINIQNEAKYRKKNNSIGFFKKFLREHDGKSKWLIKDVIKNTGEELERMFYDETIKIFELYVRTSMHWFLEQIAKSPEGEYQDTWIVEVDQDKYKGNWEFNHPLEMTMISVLNFGSGNIAFGLVENTLNYWKYGSRFKSKDLQKYNSGFVQNNTF